MQPSRTVNVATDTGEDCVKIGRAVVESEQLMEAIQYPGDVSWEM